MRTATAQKFDRSQSAIGRDLAKARAGLIVSIEDGNALIQCQVTSAIAAAMLAPLGDAAIGQFRALPGNLVEIDAVATLATAIQMLQAYAPVSQRPALH